MYPALIGAGISQLYDLFKGQTGSTSSNFQVPDTTSTTSSASTTGSTSFGTDLNRLFLDLQANATSGTDSTSATSTVANDLKTVSGDMKKAGAGHHHHHHASQTTTQATDGSTTTDPFQSMASSLLAYAKTQNLTTSASSTSTTG